MLAGTADYLQRETINLPTGKIQQAGTCNAAQTAQVDGGEIATNGVGKSGLLVPTADGVREPQNRRAVIDLL